MRELKGEAIARLAKIDEKLDAQVGLRRSLAPGRSRAHRLAELGEQLLVSDLAPERVSTFVDGLARVSDAFVRDFPENVFWDLDFLAGRMIAADASGAEAISQAVVVLSADFGRRSPISFRYAHDLLFGFDWCRWVAREPEQRGAIGPFDPGFLAYLDRRQGELRRLIAIDDAKYGQLRGAPFRNPFHFSREPEDEVRLHRALAERDLVPVIAWDVGGACRWQEPFADLRESIARELGIPRGQRSA